MPESIENVTAYHDVVATSTGTYLSLSVNKDNEPARRLIKNLINQAFTAYMENQNKELTVDQMYKEYIKLKLDEKNMDELTTYMFYFQAKAKYSGVQTYDGKARIWQRMQGRL